MGCNSPISFNVTDFRAGYPEFDNCATYPTALLTSYWTVATNFISKCPMGCVTVSQQTLGLYLMTAHIAKLMTNAATGQSSGIVTSATVEDVTVAIQPPPETTQYQWWLNQTPYGQMLLALFQVETVGGFYAGGSLDLAAFRRPARIWG